MRLFLFAILTICTLAGCGSPDKEVQEEVEEPKIKKEQYDVVWGNYDNEWVYSDDWTGEGFENFDEAMNVLDQCMKDSEEETEKCVYDYLLNNANNAE